MMTEEIRKRFSGYKKEKVDKAFSAALKAMPDMKAKTYEEKNTGEYNSIALPEKVYAIVDMKDEKGELKNLKLLSFQFPLRRESVCNLGQQKIFSLLQALSVPSSSGISL